MSARAPFGIVLHRKSWVILFTQVLVSARNPSCPTTSSHWLTIDHNSGPNYGGRGDDALAEDAEHREAGHRCCLMEALRMTGMGKERSDWEGGAASSV